MGYCKDLSKSLIIDRNELDQYIGLFLYWGGRQMAYVKVYLTIGGVKIRVLGYTPEIFSLWPHTALWGLTFRTL